MGKMKNISIFLELPYNNILARYETYAHSLSFLGGVDFKRMNGLNKKDLAPRNEIARNNDSVKRSTSMQIKQRNKTF